MRGPRYKYEYENAWMDGWVDGGMDGWMDGWIDEWISVSCALLYSTLPFYALRERGRAWQSRDEM